MPRELTTEEVYGMIDNFVKAAERAKKSGFDGTEVHVAHGYLLAQFMSYESVDWIFVTGEIPAGFNSTASEEVKKAVDVPVISVGWLILESR